MNCNSNNITYKTNTTNIMAEIIENMNHEDHIPTGRINAGLTLGFEN